MFCKNCGEKVRKSDKFCVNCGTKLNPQHTKKFLGKTQKISDISVTNDVIDITVYTSKGNCGYETHRKVGIAKKEEIKKWIIKKSNPNIIPFLLEKLDVKESSDFMEEIQKITTIIGDKIMCNSTNINIVKAILYENDIEYKEEKVNDITIIYL